jgi:hypothetical protein
MIRVALVGALVLFAVARGCGSEAGDAAIRYEVTVRFNTSVTQEDLDEVGAVLGTYDEEVEFLIQESFPPTGRAFLATAAPDFCPTIEAELEAKTYVDDVLCEEWEEAPPSSDPDEPVTSPPNRG